jgi:hypothetical protein
LHKHVFALVNVVFILCFFFDVGVELFLFTSSLVSFRIFPCDVPLLAVAVSVQLCFPVWVNIAPSSVPAPASCLRLLHPAGG